MHPNAASLKVSEAQFPSVLRNNSIPVLMENFPVSVDIYGKSPWITVLQDVIYNHSYWFETVGYLFFSIRYDYIEVITSALARDRFKISWLQMTSAPRMVTWQNPGFFFPPTFPEKDLWPKTVAPWILTHLKTQTSSVVPRRCKTSPDGLSLSRLRHRMVSNPTTCRPNFKRTTWRYFISREFSWVFVRGFRWKMFKRGYFPSGKWVPTGILEPWKGDLGITHAQEIQIYTLRKTKLIAPETLGSVRWVSFWEAWQVLC